MEKMLNNFMLVILLFVLFIPITFVNAASSESFADMEAGLREYLGSDYKEKVQKNTISANNIEKIESMFTQTNQLNSLGSNKVYPNYIGGLYIDENNNVVIQVVRENRPTMVSNNRYEYKSYQNILSVDKNSIIEYVDYSYNDINAVIQTLDEYYSENYEISNIDSYYDDIINNRVVVALKNYSDEEIANFKNNVIDSPLIHFTESQNTVDYIGYNLGAGILPMGCSVGFRAKSGNTTGFVTAGHCSDDGVGEDVPLFGTVKKYRKSGNIDAAWIQLAPLTTVSNLLEYHPQSSGISHTVNNTPVTSFVVGQLYGKAGHTSKYTYGNITSLNKSGTGGLTGLIGTSMYSTNGDSGGIVFKITGTGTNPTKYQTAGIVQGGPQGGGAMHFVKANAIVSTFGLTTY